MNVKVIRGDEVLVDTTKLEKKNQSAKSRCFVSNLDFFSRENRKEVISYIKRKHSDEWKKISQKERDTMSNDELRRYHYLKKIFKEDENVSSAKISHQFDLNIFPNGLMGGEMYVVSGLSGRGKTSFCIMLTAIQISGNNPLYEGISEFKKRKVLYISLEQTKTQISARLSSSLSALNNIEKAIPYADLLAGKEISEEAEILCYEVYSLYKENVSIMSFCDFNGTPTVDEIVLKIKEFGSDFDDKPLVVIDQYENIEGASNPQNDEIARKLKIFAESSGITLFVQAQLNKNAVAKIDTKIPTGNCLRGTSGLEHQASAILIMTPEGKTKNLHNFEAELLRFDLVKSRYSARSSCYMWHLGAFNVFMDFEDDELKTKRGRKKKNDEQDEE